MPMCHSTINRKIIRTTIDNPILFAGHLADHARQFADSTKYTQNSAGTTTL